MMRAGSGLVSMGNSEGPLLTIGPGKKTEKYLNPTTTQETM